MKVILNDYIEQLGERGDVVDVKPGFARNYLIPKALAYPDTPGNRKRFEQEQKRWEEMDLDRRSAAEKMASALVGTELLFERRAGEKNQLFGSVTVADIARELDERGYSVDRRKVLLADPIKEIGSFEVALRIHREVEVTIPVHVVRPGEQPGAAAAEQVAEAEVAAVAAVETAQAAVEPESAADDEA